MVYAPRFERSPGKDVAKTGLYQGFGPQPGSRMMPPERAASELKKLNLTRVFNDYDFDFYLIANGVEPFIGGRSELYGGNSLSITTRLFDHIDGWQKIYSDDIATVHLCKERAVHTAGPAVDPKAK
jgi:hypothetical protein